MKTTFTFEHQGNGKFKWRPFKEKDEGTEHLTVTVTQKDRGTWIIECDSYYANWSVCRLEITQHFDRAMNTFAALLEADYIQEDLDVQRQSVQQWQQEQSKRG